MCGIIGYIGNKQAAPILLHGLKKLEYRGYDSAGIAVLENSEITVKKAKGRLTVLSEMTDCGKNVSGNLGIGHTRWATHGEPSYKNSHPHISNSGRFAVVHNGIIENYIALREKLIRKGIEFVSETDTEVVAHLFEYYYNGDVLETLIKVTGKLKGSYALSIISSENPEEIVAVKKQSPMIVGLGNGENFIASDVTAILGHTKNVYYLEDDEIVILKKDKVLVYNTDREIIEKEAVTVNWDIFAAEKGGYEHFMMKEIEEQAKAVADTVNPRIDGEEIVFDIPDLFFKNIRKIYIIACGSAYHAGMIGKYVIEKLARIPTEPVLASEFRYSDPIIDERDLAVIISQSGETADTLAAMREAKKKGAKTLAVVNVLGSAIANEADFCLYTLAGPEIAVATTKAYSTQLSVMYLLGAYLGKALGTLPVDEYKKLILDIKKLPSLISEVLAKKETVQFLASKFFNCHSIFFMGRNLDYAIALEGSLKLKEISYIHSEGYAAGELKHGTISLIEKGTLVVAISTIGSLFEKTMSNVKEVVSRGAVVFGITCENNPLKKNLGDFVFEVPEISECLMPSLVIIPLQLFSYYVASLKGLDIDKPRNLAKSVTVE